MFNIEKSILENLENAKFKTQTRHNGIMIELILVLQKKEIPTKIALPIVKEN